MFYLDNRDQSCYVCELVFSGETDGVSLFSCDYLSVPPFHCDVVHNFLFSVFGVDFIHESVCVRIPAGPVTSWSGISWHTVSCYP